MLFVSPELSSGRDLVIQMSVRRAGSAVRVFLSGAYLGNRMTYLDDIWYVGGARSESAHAEFWEWQVPIKYLICIIYAKICQEHFSGTVCPTWMVFGMWVAGADPGYVKRRGRDPKGGGRMTDITRK